MTIIMYYIIQKMPTMQLVDNSSVVISSRRFRHRTVNLILWNMRVVEIIVILEKIKHF